MKNRIRLIFFLMGACILGINLFQGYWLYQSYRVNYRDFSRRVNQALFQAAKQQELRDVDRTIGLRTPAGEGPAEGRQITIVRRGEGRLSPPDSAAAFIWSADTAAAGGGHQFFRIRLRDSVDVLRARIAADTLAREISTLLILNKFYERGFDLDRFDTLYRDALRQQGIDAVFRLDTLRLPEAHPGGVNTLFVDVDDPPVGGEVTTPVVPVNLLSNLFVRAVFPNPRFAVLRGMTGLLAASLLLFLLTTGCLVYMLRTILAQKKLSEIKSDFINNMTHELKTPIATVSAAVEALQHFDAIDDRARTHDYLEISRQELGRLSDLVEKVLHIAVEERRDLELHAEPTDVAALLEQLVRRQQLRATKPAAIRLETRLDDPVVRLDRVHFTNAISNLLDNAIKYSYDEVDVLVRCERDDGWLRVTVRDNGIGIPRDYQHSIFEQFFRVPQGDLHNVKGFGLGLAYVKKIVEKHGGAIRVSSELRKGSEFVIRIPG